MIKFEWNAAKAATNIKKHGVSFEEAKSVFFDEFALQFFDQDNSKTEDRFLMLGMSNQTNLLLVCHCERDDGNTIIIGESYSFAGGLYKSINSGITFSELQPAGDIDALWRLISTNNNTEKIIVFNYFKFFFNKYNNFDKIN